MNHKRFGVALLLLLSIFEVGLCQNVFPNIFPNLPIPEILYPNPEILDEEIYDFIIVGSGSAGSVIANRLSEITKWKILLLEVGEEPNFITDIPALAAALQFTNYNWNYLMEKQENVCLAMEGQRMYWQRGKALGGSTVINYMIHTRGNKKDYDRWAALGNPGWSYEDVLPYFKKSEDYKVLYQDPEYHQHGGYLHVNDVPYRTKSVDIFLKAAQQAGYPVVDYNGKEHIGVSYVHSDTENGRRWSVEKGFLRPVRRRQNLTILTKARVVKILIDAKSRNATGVQFVKNRKYYTAKVRKEVILSAGALSSPQLLMLSGIGPRDNLEELKIPVILDLPVGEKLYDHITFAGMAFTFNTSIVLTQSLLENPVSALQFVLDGNGPLTWLGGVEALAYFKTNISTYSDDYPDIELIFLGGGLQIDRGQIHRKTFRITDEFYNGFFKDLENIPALQILPMLLQPKSVGYLKLKSKNPYHWPKFYGNYFTDPDNLDIKTFIESIREIQRIMAMPAFQRVGVQLYQKKFPGCDEFSFNSDEYWECVLRHISPTLNHQVATCKMGPKDDPEAVVDHRLKVHGMKNLRVADTSIIPIALTAHSSVPAIMVGEKLADVVKEDWMKNESDIDFRTLNQ